MFEPIITFLVGVGLLISLFVISTVAVIGSKILDFLIPSSPMKDEIDVDEIFGSLPATNIAVNKKEETS